MNKYLKILTLLFIFVLISGCLEEKRTLETKVDKIIQHKILKIDGDQIYFYDEDGFIKTIGLEDNLFLVESNKTMLEYQEYGFKLHQYILYVNIT